MFTGIVEAMGRVAEAGDADGVREIRVETPPGFLEGVQAGASIAVDGACLTPVDVDPEGFTVEAVGTTLSRTLVGGYCEGSVVNLERAMRLGDRLDGHLVQGHVDGIGHLLQIQDVGGFRILEVSIPLEVHELTLVHGSIALNGVSLTVNRLESDDRVEVAVIPRTWEATNFRYLSLGDPINVEGDLIGKYVGRLLRYKKDRLEGGSRDAL